MSNENSVYFASRDELLDALESEDQHAIYTSTKRFKILLIEEILNIRLGVWDKQRPRINNDDLDKMIEAGFDKDLGRPELEEVLELD
jgi:hypothetical protein